jgi:hypothetical protein
MLDQFQHEFFPHTEQHTVTFEVTSDDWAAVQQAIAENEWGEADGLRFLLAAGVAFAQGQARLAALNHPDADLAEEVRRLQTERMQVESRYAVMKFRAFTFMQAAKLLEMKLNACQGERERLRQANLDLRQQDGRRRDA